MSSEGHGAGLKTLPRLSWMSDTVLTITAHPGGLRELHGESDGCRCCQSEWPRGPSDHGEQYADADDFDVRLLIARGYDIHVWLRLSEAPSEASIDLTNYCREVQAGEEGWAICVPEPARTCGCYCGRCLLQTLIRGSLRLQIVPPTATDIANR